MIFDLIRNGLSFELIINLMVRIFVIFCVLPIHEFAHAFIAHKLGDDTARLKGRMTINPLAHIDPFGALMIIIGGFGYAKAVPVNIRNFKKRKPYMAITALAGPVSNIIMSIFFMFFTMLIQYKIGLSSDSGILYNVAVFLMTAAQINISLAVFNLLPIPPLDGSRIFSLIIPDKYYYGIMQYERYIMIGLFVLLFTGILSTPLSYLSMLISNLIYSITSLPF